MIGLLFELKDTVIGRAYIIRVQLHFKQIYWEIGFAFGTRVVIRFSCHSVHSKIPCL